MEDVVLLRGAFQWALLDLKGNILKKQLIDNTVVTVGRAFVLKQLQSVNHNTDLNMSHIAVGSGLVAPATGDTALGNEVTRKAISSFATAELTANPPFWQAQAVIASNEGNTTLGEAGMFNSSTAGTMLCRATFASFVKATSNILNLSWNLSA